MLQRPRHLEVRHSKSYIPTKQSAIILKATPAYARRTSKRTRKVDQRTDLPLVLRERVVAVRVHRDRVDHHRELGDAPAHHERADAEVLLDRRAERDEAADVQRDGDVARPAWRR